MQHIIPALFPEFLVVAARRELGNVGHAETCLDRANLFHSIFKTVLTKLFVFDIFKLIIHLVELLASHGLFPGWKNNRIFSRRVVAIHHDKRFQSACQLFGIGSTQLWALSQAKYVVGNLAPAIVLYDQNVRITGSLSARLLYRWKDIDFLQFLFMIILAERLKQFCGFLQRIGW